MQIIFKENLTDLEAIESFHSLLRLFKERYGIENYREISMHFNLLDREGEEVELVDAQTSKVFGVFEVYKSGQIRQHSITKPSLSLVVDNTKALGDNESLE